MHSSHNTWFSECYFILEVNGSLYKECSKWLYKQVIETESGNKIKLNYRESELKLCQYTTLFFLIDKPEITSTKDSLYRVIEGQNITLDCVLTAANPNTSIEWTWYNSNNTKNVIKRRPIYTIFNIQRNNTGTYSCSASNIIGTSVPVSIDVDVQCKFIA